MFVYFTKWEVSEGRLDILKQWEAEGRLLICEQADLVLGLGPNTIENT